MLFPSRSPFAACKPKRSTLSPAAPPDVEDRHLIEAAVGGDSAAFERLVTKYEHRLHRALERMCRSVADAHDAAQETFLRAYLKLSTFTSSKNFYTWLYRIAVNTSINEHRRRRAKRLDGRSLEIAAPTAADRGEMPVEHLLREERAQFVQRHLAALTEDHREVLVLREIDDQDYDEIARILNIPVGTVRSRLHRARLQFREKLLEEAPEAAPNAEECSPFG